MKLTDRKFFLVNCLICIVSFAIVLYLQFGQGIHPCALCVFQRAGVVGVFCFSLIGLVFAFKSFLRYINYLLLFVSGGFGVAAAIRQVWIQHLPPDQVQACGAGLAFLMKEFSITKTVATVFEGSGSCAKVHLYVGGLNIAEWSLVMFLIVLLWSLWGLFAGRQK